MLIVFLLALIVRTLYFAQVRQCPLFRIPTIDAGVYYTEAQRLFAGHWLDPIGRPYWQPPFYPIVLAVLMKLLGHAVYNLKLAQFTLGAINCALVFALGERVFNRKVGIIAGIGAALYGPMIYFDGELLTPTLQIFFNLCALLTLLKALEQNSAWKFALAGLLLGLSIITRPDAVILLFAAAIWAFVCLRRMSSAKNAAVMAAILLIFGALPTAPIAARNVIVGNDRVLISSNGGLNFYIGNNERDNYTRDIRPGPEWEGLQNMATRENPNALPSEKSAYFYHKAGEFAISHPMLCAKLMVKKVVMYMTSIEIRRNHDLYHYRQYSPLYSALMFRLGSYAFPFAALFPLAVFGLMRCRPGRNCALLYLYIMSQFLVAVLFFVCARYRVTAVPALLIFAAFGAVELWNTGKAGSWRSSVVPLAAAIIALLITSTNLYGIDTNKKKIDSDTFLYSGLVLEEEGKLPEAERDYAESIRLGPKNPVSRYQYSVLLINRGKYDEARRQAITGLQLTPRSVSSGEQFFSVFEALVAQDNKRADNWIYLGAAYYQSRNMKNAQWAFDKAKAIGPADQVKSLISDLLHEREISSANKK